MRRSIVTRVIAIAALISILMLFALSDVDYVYTGF